MKSNFVFVSALMALLLLAACGPTYVQHSGYVDPNGGYVDPNGYVQPLYDPNATIVVVGGQQGYYGVNHIFYPSIVVGGYSGYYDSGHHFVSSAPAVRDAVKTGKPLYAGPSGSQTVNKTTVNNTTVNNNVTATKPAYGSGAGVAQRGMPTPQPTPQATGRAAYGNGAGVAQRSAPAAAPAARPASVSARPSYSSSSGSSSRGKR